MAPPAERLGNMVVLDVEKIRQLLIKLERNSVNIDKTCKVLCPSMQTKRELDQAPLVGPYVRVMRNVLAEEGL